MDNGREPDTRSLLLAAAAEEFARFGPKGARVAAIVARAGVNERMIYHHFRGKEGLYRAVVEAAVAELGVAWRAALGPVADLPPREGLRRAFEVYFEVFRARPLLMPLLVHESLTGWTVRPPLTAGQLPAELRELYLRGQRAGVFRADLDFAVLYAGALSALVSAPVMRGLLADAMAEAPGARRVRDQIVNLLLDGVSGPAAQRGGGTG